MQKSEFHVLVVDDDPGICLLIQSLLGQEGYHVDQALTGEEALRRIAAPPACHAVLLDIFLPDHNGLEVLRSIKSGDHPPPVIMITGYSSIETAVESIKLGAEDYITKPIQKDDKLKRVVDRIFQQTLLETQNELLKQELLRRSVPEIVGQSKPIRELLADITAVAGSDAPTIICGDSGSGKELVARAIHNLSARAAEPFVPVNCASVPKDLLESEFYGHEKGSFSGALNRKYGLFEVADKGTLFLDEIAEMPLDLQAKLLRTVESKRIRRVGGTEEFSVDIRIVCATNRDLKQEIGRGRFREDLYFRLSTFFIHVPSLRDRTEDIPLLVDHFVSKKGHGPIPVPADVLESFRRYAWPGNVRELEHVIERCLLFSNNQSIKFQYLPEEIKDLGRRRIAPKPAGAIPSLADVEKQHILEVYEQCNRDKVQAAKILGVGLQTLYRKLAKYKSPSKNSQNENSFAE